DLAKDVARSPWCVRAGGHRTLLSARNRDLYGTPADNDRFDAALSNPFLKFSQNRTQDIAFGSRLPARICRNRRRLVSRRRGFLARFCGRAWRSRHPTPEYLPQDVA